MRMLTSGRFALLGLLVVAMATVACTGSDGSGVRAERDAAQQALAQREGGIQPAPAPAPGGNGAAPGQPGSGAPEGSIAVTLDEWSVVASGTGAAGSVTFATTNAGAIPHELAVVRTDLAHDQIPQAGGMADESQVQMIGRTSTFLGGESENLTVNLEAGNYVLLCNIVGHYQLGMHTGFSVQ